MNAAAQNPKAHAWDGLGAAYWDHDYDGGPSDTDCERYLTGVAPGDPVLVVGASTIRLVRAALGRGVTLTVADFSPVMLAELRREMGDRIAYRQADVTRPGSLPPGRFRLIAADRLLNRFTRRELRLALATLAGALRRDGELRLSYRLGLYDRDLPVLAEARRRGVLSAVFDEREYDVDYGPAVSWLASVLPPHGRISMADLVAFYVRRGREHRFRDGELDRLVAEAGQAPLPGLAVSHLDLPAKPSDRMLVVNRLE